MVDTQDSGATMDATTLVIAAPAEGSLRYLGVLRFSGAHAQSFLQGQVSQDTRLLAERPLLAAYSSPQGRVVALLHLLPHSTGILALLPREILLPTLERLRKFVMRAKVTIEDVSEEFAVYGLHRPEALKAAGLPVPSQAAGYLEDEALGVAIVGDGARFWVVGKTDGLERRGFDTSPGEMADGWVERDWRLADIHGGRPQVYAATREMFVAQMLNLDLLDAISFTKGCYTGQEIIARTQHLGRIKRRLSRLQLPPGTWALGQAVQLEDGRTGRLTEIVAGPKVSEALAVLTLPTAAGAPTEAGDSAAPATTPPLAPIKALEIPLPYAMR